MNEINIEGTRLACFGMKDVTEMVREYVDKDRVALSFAFDESDQVWILWRAWNGDVYYCCGNGPRTACEAGHLDRDRHGAIRVVRTQEDQCALLMGCNTFREFYVNPDGVTVQSHGIDHPAPPGYVAFRLNRFRYYGLLPSGAIEQIPYSLVEAMG